MANNSFNYFDIPISRAFEEDGDMFIEVPVSGVFQDDEGDVNTRSCGNSLIKQYKSGNVLLYGEHEGNKTGDKPNYNWKNIMGNWIDAEWDKNGIDIVAKARINKNNPDGVLLYKYVKDKIPVGFSIGGEIIRDDDI